MESTSNILKWLCFSGLSDEYPVWSTRFQAFSQTKGLFETLTGDDVPPNPPGRLTDPASDEIRAAHDAAIEADMKAVIDIQKRNNTLWCYFAMVLDSTILMLIRHDCVDIKGLCDGGKAWVLLQQKFRSDETVTVVSVMRQWIAYNWRKMSHFTITFFAHKNCPQGFNMRDKISQNLIAKCDGAQWFAWTLWTLCGAGKLQSCR